MFPDQYVHRWDLTDALLIASTKTSDVYRVRSEGRDAVLKVLTEIGQKYEGDSAEALRVFAGRGAVQLYRADQGALLVEFAGGRQLKHLVESGDDERACEIACDVLAKLHFKPAVKPANIIRMEQNFRALFAKVEMGETDPIFGKAATVARKLLESEHDAVMLHGDIHHGNILESESRGWLAIDPQPIWGEKTYDFANLFFNPDNLPELVERPERIEMMLDVFERIFAINRTRILEFAFAFGCLSVSWCLEDGTDPSRRLRLSRLLHARLVSI
jgi:streptomycin 6-kinase